MKFRWPTVDETNAALRHVYTTVGAVTSALVIVGLTQGQATVIGNAVHQIGDGVAAIVAGVGALLPFINGARALISASPLSRLWQMQNNPDIKQVVAVPGTATAALTATIPGDKITAQ